MEKTKMTLQEAILAAQRAEVPSINVYPENVHGHVTNMSVVDSVLIDTIRPVSYVSGFRSNELTRLLSPNTPISERELILNSLAYSKGYNSPKELSDEELLSLIPSRYLSDPVEIENYRQFVEQLKAQAEYEKNKADGSDTRQTGNEPVGAAPGKIDIAGNTAD